MKNTLLIACSVLALSSYSQWSWNINFDDGFYIDQIVPDLVSNPACSWQTGIPQKVIFDSANSPENALVTDLVNPVAAQDTSTFYLIHERTPDAYYHVFWLHFMFRMDGDTSDFGTVEISPDEGLTWINILEEDTTYDFDWWASPKPELKGSTVGWQPFDVYMGTWASAMEEWGDDYPVFITEDTVLFRFTYITDEGAEAHDGWMLDDFYIEDWYEGVEEMNREDFVSVFPNPVDERINIIARNSYGKSAIRVFDMNGQLVMDETQFTGSELPVEQLTDGIYLLSYMNNGRSDSERFIVQH